MPFIGIFVSQLHVIAHQTLMPSKLSFLFRKSRTSCFSFMYTRPHPFKGHLCVPALSSVQMLSTLFPTVPSTTKRLQGAVSGVLQASFLSSSRGPHAMAQAFRVLTGGAALCRRL